jgi:hypothetical protein
MTRWCVADVLFAMWQRVTLFTLTQPQAGGPVAAWLRATDPKAVHELSKHMRVYKHAQGTLVKHHIVVINHLLLIALTGQLNRSTHLTHLRALLVLYDRGNCYYNTSTNIKLG